MTLPDRIVEVLRENNGILVDNERKVNALVASLLGEKDVDVVRQSVEALRNNELVYCSARKVELTRKGWLYMPAEEPAKGGGNSNGVTIVPADPSVILRLGKRASVGGQLVEQFLASEQAAVRVTGYTGKRQSLLTALKSHIKKNGYDARVEARAAGGDVYLLLLTHVDVRAAKGTK